MTILEIAILIGGGLNSGLSLILKELGVIRAKYPDTAEQIDKLTEWLSAQTDGKFTVAALKGVAAQIVGLVSGKGWGPPNPGSIAGA